MPAQTNQKSHCIGAALVLVILAAAILPFAHSVLAQRTVGFVLNLHGDWVLNSSQPLKPGSPLLAGGWVRARSPSDVDFIEIADRRGQVIIHRNCGESDCKQPVHLPRDDSGIISRVLEAGLAIIFNDPTKFEVLISRGGELREAVVKVSGEQAELSSVMSNKGSGKYFLRLIPKSAGVTTADREPPVPVGVEWDPNKLLVVSIKGLTPGLYEVQLLNGQDMEPEGPGTEAWVLFVRPERFDEASCSFSEATNLANSWGRATREDTKREFLRGFLAHMDSKRR